MTNKMGDTRQCPECGDVFDWIDGKDKRRYASHLEDHLEDRL